MKRYTAFHSPVDLEIFHTTGCFTFSQKDFKAMVTLTTFVRLCLRRQRTSKDKKVYKVFFDEHVSRLLRKSHEQSHDALTVQPIFLTQALIQAVKRQFGHLIDPFEYFVFPINENN